MRKSSVFSSTVWMLIVLELFYLVEPPPKNKIHNFNTMGFFSWVLKANSMSNRARCQFVNDDSPPFLFIPHASFILVCPTIAISWLICLTVGLNIPSLGAFHYSSWNIRNPDSSHSTNVEVMYKMDTRGFYSDCRNSLSRTSPLAARCFGPRSVQRCGNVMAFVFTGPPRVELVVSTLPFVVASHTLLESHHDVALVISLILVLTFLLSSSHNLPLGGSKHPFVALTCGRCWPLETFMLRGVNWWINCSFLSPAAPVWTF